MPTNEPLVSTPLVLEPLSCRNDQQDTGQRLGVECTGPRLAQGKPSRGCRSCCSVCVVGCVSVCVCVSCGRWACQHHHCSQTCESVSRMVLGVLPCVCCLVWCVWDLMVGCFRWTTRSLVIPERAPGFRTISVYVLCVVAMLVSGSACSSRSRLC